MFTADPRHVPRARLIRSLTYREAQELAAMGAKVLHPRCLLPAAHAGLPVEVRNTMDASPHAEMTVVSATGLDYLSHAQRHRGGSSSEPTTLESTGGGGGAIDAKALLAMMEATGGGAGGDTPRFGPSSPPTNRSPSPLASSSSRIVYSSSSSAGAGGGGGSGDGVAAAAAAGPSGGGGGGRESPSFAIAAGSSGELSPRSASIAAPPSVEGLLSQAPKILAVARRKGVTLVNMAAFDMWGHSGFLSRVFAPFAAHGVSVDLIATSQYAVSVTLDHIPEGVYGDTMRKVVVALSRQCSTSVRYPCAVVSIVGRSLRNALPTIGRAMRALGHRRRCSRPGRSSTWFSAAIVSRARSCRRSRC